MMGRKKVRKREHRKLGSRSKSSLKPWVTVALVWGVITTLGLCFFSSVEAGLWVLLLWFLSMLDLLALSKAVYGALAVSAEPEGSTRRPALMIQAMIWAFAKFMCLGALAAALWFARTAPQWALPAGLSGLLVVPIVGGLWWSQTQLADEES